MADKYQGFSSLISQAERWAALPFHDANPLPDTPKAIRCQAAGNVSLVGSDDVAVVFAVAAGETLDVRPKRINATGTTVGAGSVIGLFD